MSRIRTIKPEFSQSETVGKLSRPARLLFIQLWPICDDTGRARGADRYLAGQLYPYDDDAPEEIGGWLDELQRNGFIRRYEVDGTKYLDIPTWSKHQRVDNAAKSRIPEFSPGASQALEVGREPPRTAESCGDNSEPAASGGDPPLGPRTLDLVPRKEDSRRIAIATAADFEKFWEIYPRREGSNPKKPAAEKFLRLVLSGVSPAAIIAGAKRYADECARLKTEGRFITQAVVFLNQQRFADYNEKPAETQKIIRPRHGQTLGPEFGEKAAGKVFVLAETPEWDAWCGYVRDLGKPAPPRYFHEGWAFTTLWPPGYEPQTEAAE